MAKLEDLIESQNWEEAKKRIAKLKGQNRKKLDHALDLAVRDPDIPLDLVTEIVKKYRKEYDKYYESGVETLLWDRLSGRTWESVCRRESTDMMNVFLKELFDDEGLKGVKPEPGNLYGTILLLWRRYLVHNETEGFPLNLHWDYYGRAARREQREAKEDAENELLSIKSMEDLKECPGLNLLWEKTVLLFDYARTADNIRGRALARQEQGLLVHDMVSAKLPPIVVWLADRLYPNTLGTRDSQGLLPLHHAIRASDDNGLHVSFSGELSIANGSVYKLLVSIFPEASQYLDREGSLPLTFLLKQEQRCDLEDVEALVKAEPRALITRDIKTGFYPFTTAAARGRHALYGYRTANSKEELSLVYALLRANPLAISAGIKENDHELYLKKKLAAAESQVTRLEKDNATLIAENKQKDKEIEKLRAELHSIKNEAPALKRSAPAGTLPDGKKART